MGPASDCLSAPGTSSQFSTGADRATSPLVSLYPALECRALIQQMSPSAFGKPPLPRAQGPAGERGKQQQVLKGGSWSLWPSSRKGEFFRPKGLSHRGREGGFVGPEEPSA